MIKFIQNLADLLFMVQKLKKTTVHEIYDGNKLLLQMKLLLFQLQMLRFCSFKSHYKPSLISWIILESSPWWKLMSESRNEKNLQNYIFFPFYLRKKWWIDHAICHSNYTTQDNVPDNQNNTAAPTEHYNSQLPICVMKIKGLTLQSDSRSCTLLKLLVPRFPSFLLQYRVCADHFDNRCSTQRALATTTYQLVCAFWTSAHMSASAVRFSFYIWCLTLFRFSRRLQLGDIPV